MQENISFLAAFLGGIVSFFSPCILPLVPSYICYITGASFDDLQENIKQKRRAVALNSFLFIIGFSIVFISFGVIASYFGCSLKPYRNLITKTGAVIIILFGLHLIGIFRIKFLDKEAKINLKNKPLGYFGSLLAGVVFAAGWTPCVGPLLSSILLHAATKEVSTSVVLLSFYSLGLGLPLFIIGISIDNFILVFNKVKNLFKRVQLISGMLLVLVGILLFTDSLQFLANWSMALFEGKR